ncbi:unnamed protein product [Rhodiola kirilowii]
MAYSSESTTFVTGDYVGVESCVDLRSAEEFEAYAKDRERSYDQRRLGREAKRRRERWNEFPLPMISHLAQTENQRSHMPWVMKRYYTADGRLVIRKEMVRRHEYFRAHRADDRLVLQLIGLDDDDFENCCSIDDHHGVDVEIFGDRRCTNLGVIADDDCGGGELKIEVEDDKEEAEDAKEEEEEERAVDDGIAAEVVAGDEAKLMMSNPVMVSSASMSALCISMAGGGFASRGGRVNKCFGFNTLRSSSASCLFDLQVPAISHVIS